MVHFHGSELLNLIKKIEHMKTKLAIIFIALTIASGHSQTIKPIESAHTDSEFAKNVYYKDT